MAEEQTYAGVFPARGGGAWLRYTGVLLPLLINYGFLLATEDDPHWVTLLASVVILLGCAGWLLGRRDRAGAIWIIALYLPLNAWPIVVNAIGGLGD